MRQLDEKNSLTAKRLINDTSLSGEVIIVGLGIDFWAQMVYKGEPDNSFSFSSVGEGGSSN